MKIFLDTASLDEIREGAAMGVVDGVTRWLVVTRAGVLPMTLTSGLIAVLLAGAGTLYAFDRANAETIADETGAEGTGLYRYVHDGERYLPSEYTADVEVFDPDVAVTEITDPPASEVPPDYPRP